MAKLLVLVVPLLCAPAFDVDADEPPFEDAFELGPPRIGCVIPMRPRQPHLCPFSVPGSLVEELVGSVEVVD